MAGDSVVYAAARNNAEWCDAFCSTHGIAGRLEVECWTSPERTPPLYPDAVTLAPDVAPAQLLALIDASGGCSVKDSFADLDLSDHGFRVLFRAEWLFCDEKAAPASSHWSIIETQAQLRDWESAWGASPGETGFFRPALLANEAIAMLARYDGDRIAAGAIANRSTTVVGLSNVFDTDDDLASTWQDAAVAARTYLGSVPVVAYDSGADLEAAHEAGFRSVGDLAVWGKPAPAD